MHELIPHQLALTKLQIGKLMKGQGINIPFDQMGSHKGDSVVLFHPSNAKKMLTAYKKGKGVRISMSDAEREASAVHGRGFGKKLGRALKSAGKATASSLIHAGIPAVMGVAGDMLGGPAGGVAGAIAGDMVANRVGKATGYGMQEARSHYMKVLRSMRGMSQAEKDKIKGSGFFKSLKKYTGINKTDVIKTVKDTGKMAVQEGATMLGTAIGAYTGNPALGASMGHALGKAGVAGLDSIEATKKGIKVSPGESVKSLKKDARAIASMEMDRLVDTKVPPEYRKMSKDILAGKPVSKAVEEQMDRVSLNMQGSGMPRAVGRPRKVLGMGAKTSTAFKQAMSANFNGLELSGTTQMNEPISKFDVNKNVRPSSDEMTLSPYQSITSPAMNPFIPKNYLQQGGQTSGYGGRGLYGGGLY